MIQVSGAMPALSDGVGAKKPAKKKTPRATKRILDLLASRVKGAK